MFELIYKQVVPRAPAYLGLSLSVSGKKIFKKIKVEKPKPERENTPIVPKLKQEEESNTKSRPSSSSVVPELLSWLQPYDNPENIPNVTKEFERKPTPTVQHALTVVKSGLLLKTSTKKRKSTSNTSLKKHSAKKDRNQNKTKTPTSMNYCCRSDNELKDSNVKDMKKIYKTQNKTLEKIYWHDPNTVKSVGNKRCYIEPATWERDTASILRSCSSSVLHQNGNKSENRHPLQVTPRVFSPGIMAFHKMLRKGTNDNPDGDTSKAFSSISLNIKKLKHYKRSGKRSQDTEKLNNNSHLTSNTKQT